MSPCDTAPLAWGGLQPYGSKSFGRGGVDLPRIATASSFTGLVSAADLAMTHYSHGKGLTRFSAEYRDLLGAQAESGGTHPAWAALPG